VCVCVRACVRACVHAWVGGWVGVCVCVCVESAYPSSCGINQLIEWLQV